MHACIHTYIHTYIHVLLAEQTCTSDLKTCRLHGNPCTVQSKMYMLRIFFPWQNSHPQTRVNLAPNSYEFRLKLALQIRTSKSHQHCFKYRFKFAHRHAVSWFVQTTQTPQKRHRSTSRSVRANRGRNTERKASRASDTSRAGYLRASDTSPAGCLPRDTSRGTPPRVCYLPSIVLRGPPPPLAYAPSAPRGSYLSARLIPPARDTSARLIPPPRDTSSPAGYLRASDTSSARLILSIYPPARPPPPPSAPRV